MVGFDLYTIVYYILCTAYCKMILRSGYRCNCELSNDWTGNDEEILSIKEVVFAGIKEL